jgi:hypothetical protein
LAVHASPRAPRRSRNGLIDRGAKFRQSRFYRARQAAFGVNSKAAIERQQFIRRHASGDLPDGQTCHSSVQPLPQKDSAFAVGQISFRSPPVPRHQEGRIAIVTTRGQRNAVDAGRAKDERATADGEVVWSRYLDADIKFLRS